MQNIESVYTIIIALITVLGSAGAWKFYERKSELRRDEDNFIKTDCRDRITKLEQLLERSALEKELLRDTVLQLTREVAALHVKVDFLERENKRLLEQHHN
jgi:hypothetical protein